jgi:protein-S-isoprenylcysteine O-methyltransferase Ste14
VTHREPHGVVIAGLGRGAEPLADGRALDRIEEVGRVVPKTSGSHAGRTARAALGSSLFFVLAPGVVAGLIPWLITKWRPEDPYPWPIRAMGAVLLVTGAVVVVSAFARFVTEGSGTPAPVAPTRRLVTGGLYRHVRNPMYVAVLAAIVGQALVLGRPSLLVYGAVVAIAFATFVRFYEEPTLLRTFGAEFEEYRRAVPGWRPRLRPWTPGGDRSPRS